MRSIYLDYNGTTPIAPRVQEAMLPFLAEQFGDPRSDHTLGRSAAQAIDDARFRVTKAIGAKSDYFLLFTSGGTEGCHLAITGVVTPMRRISAPARVVYSGVEHSCVEHLLFGWSLHDDLDATNVPCDDRGLVDPKQVEARLRFAPTALVCVAHADGVTGVVQPIAEIASVCHEHDALLMVDASASFGKIPVDVEQLSADILVISGHKAYGPKGVGALYLRDNVTLDLPIMGDGLNTRAGMPNVPGIVGLGYAAELAAASLTESASRLSRLRDELEARLSEGCGEALTIVGKNSPRLPNTSLVGFEGMPFDRLADAAPELILSSVGGEHGMARNRCLYHPGDPVQRVTLPEAVRLSLGWYTTEEEIDRAASLLLDAWERLQGR